MSSETMSIPIEFSVGVRTKEFSGTLIQLKEGSVYILKLDLEPVSRGFAGSALKDTIKSLQHIYIAERKEYKLILKSKDYLLAEEKKVSSERTLEVLREVRQCWVKFKSHSRKTKKPLTKQALKKKEAALKAKRAKVEGAFTHKVSMEKFKHGPK